MCCLVLHAATRGYWCGLSLQVRSAFLTAAQTSFPTAQAPGSAPSAYSTGLEEFSSMRRTLRD